MKKCSRKKLSKARTQLLMLVDGEVTKCRVEYDRVTTDDDNDYYVFANSKEAGKAARKYWEDLAQQDSKEFICLVGEETLLRWALGQCAGPGSTQVSSLSEWLDLWLDTPEEHFAGYDDIENDCQISAALAKELDIENPNDEDWVEVVSYRT